MTQGAPCAGDPNELAKMPWKNRPCRPHRTIMAGAPGKVQPHMFIISPFAAKEAKSLFPLTRPTEDRIRRLREQAERM